MVILALLLASTSIVGSVEVGPDDMNWRSSVEAAPAGTTVSFLPGVYRGCNVAVPTGVTLAANTSSTTPVPTTTPGKHIWDMIHSYV